MSSIKKKIGKTKYAYILAGILSMLIVLSVFFVVRLRVYATQGNTLTDIPESVTIEGKTYTKDNPMIIMEIVPDLSMGEIGYLIGGENNPVTASDLNKIRDLMSNKDSDNSLLNMWRQPINAFSNTSWDAVSADDVITGFEDRNLFANAIYGNSCMSDKMKVVVVTASALSLRDVNGETQIYDSKTDKSYDPGLVYVHENVHNNTVVDIYNKMAEYNAQFNQGMKYQKQTYSKFTDNNNQNNLRGDVAFELYLRSAKYKTTALIMDRNINGISYIKDGDNVAKLALLSTSIEQETFVNMFAQNKNADGTWTGSYVTDDVNITGKVVVSDKNFDMYYSGTSVGKIGYIYTGYCNKHSPNPQMVKEGISGGEYTHNIPEQKLNWSTGNMFLNSELTKIYTIQGQYVHNHHNSTNESDWTWDVNITNEWCSDTSTRANYPYYNPIDDSKIYQSNVHLSGKIMLFHGDNFMDMKFFTESRDYNDYNFGTEDNPIYGTDYGKLDKESDGKIKNTEIVKYILGSEPVFETQTVEHINVLEIEPSSDYKYTDFETAKKIVNYFKNADFPDMNESNYKDYINVKSVSSVEFNGMNEDIIEIYDLIIVSDNNQKGIITPAIINNKSYIYYSRGQILTLKTSKMSNTDKNNKMIYQMSASGNDLTDKAYEKLENYALSGKPLMLADCIYNSGESAVFQTIDSFNEDINMYKLSPASIKKNNATVDLSNIVVEPSEEDYNRGKYSKVVYRFTPVVTVDTVTEGSNSKAFKCSYNKNGLIDTSKSFSSNDLSAFTMTGTIGTSADKTYGVKIYFDRDGNGIYSEDTSSEQSELFYDGQVTTGEDGRFVTDEFELPETLRGYIRWKIVVKNLSSGYTSEDTGGLVISYGENEHTTVNVLQIYPGTKNLDMDSTTFKNVFNSDVSNITGYDLKVTLVSTDTYNKEYNQVKYDLSKYDMVVMGFADDYNYKDLNINAANKIIDFVHQGKALLLSHDTTLYTAYSDGVTINKKWSYNGKTHSYIVTSAFRALVGMDAYGVTTQHDSVLQYKQGFSNYFLSKYADLTGEDETYEYKFYGGQSDVKQGDNIRTDTVEKLNIGQVTEYPYRIDDTIKVAETHGQWFQIDLEKQDDTGANDVVVWYTLAQSSNNTYKNESKYYSLPGKDAAQNYYIYSKGNITYSGAGHRTINGKSELQLFVNTIIKAISAANNAPKAVFDNAVDTGEDAMLYEKVVHDIDADEEKGISFTVSDIDMGASTNATFPLAYLFWDVDMDGRYTKDKDIVIKTYENELHNRTEITVEFSDIYRDEAGKEYTYNKVTLENALKSNSAALGIVAYDSKGAYGQSAVKITQRNFFKLE